MPKADRSCCRDPQSVQHKFFLVQGRLIEARHIFQHLRGREDVSDELGSVIENMEVGPSPLEEWLVKPEDVRTPAAGSGFATPMTPGSRSTKSFSLGVEDEVASAVHALEEARARAAFIAIAEGRELSYRPPLEAVLEDIEKGTSVHNEATSVPATPIFEQTTILAVDWSAVRGSPLGTPRKSGRLPELACADSQNNPEYQLASCVLLT